MPRPKFIAGNWKMYTTAASARALALAVAQGMPNEEELIVAVCPPFPWLAAVAETLAGSRVKLGAQNCHSEAEGAFTGDVSPQMLKDVGCEYVIVGHSERRHGAGETDEFLNRKAKAALAVGLKVIFCVGELLAEREANRTEEVLETQLAAGLGGLLPASLDNLVIAYEPVWAIGTGNVATPQQAQDAHAFVRGKFSGMFGEIAASSLLIQYGGSVKADNALALLSLPDVDGALVGGASLKAETFLGIVRAAG